MDNDGNMIIFGNQPDGTIVRIVIREDGSLYQQVLNQAEFAQARAQALAGDQGHTLDPTEAQISALATHFGVHIQGRRPEPRRRSGGCRN